MYEVLTSEPHHDVKEHISNTISEISAHLSDDAKKVCEGTLSLVSGTKDQLRGSDYREIYIVLAKQLRGEHCSTIEIKVPINFIFNYISNVQFALSIIIILYYSLTHIPSRLVWTRLY